jgi:hypothetical protein
VSNELIESLKIAIRANPATRNVDQFLSTLTKLPRLNDREVLGVLTTLFSKNYMGRAEVDKIIVALCRAALKHKVMETNEALKQVLRGMVDGPLARSYERLKRGGESPQGFMETRPDLCGFLMSEGDFDIVVQAGQTLSNAAGALHRLSSQSALGQAMFQAAALQADVASFSADLARIFLPLYPDKAFAESSLARARAESDALVKRWEEVAELSQARRAIEVPVLGAKVSLVVAKCQVWALLKHHAARFHEQHFPELPFEPMVREEKRLEAAVAVPGWLQPRLEDMARARTALSGETGLGGEGGQVLTQRRACKRRP